MKLISDVKDINNLDDLLALDEILIPTRFSVLYETSFNETEIDSIISWCIYNSKRAILKVDRIFEESEIKILYSFLDKYKNYDINFAFSDLSVLAYFKRINMLHKLIYSAQTYMTNYFDINYYKSMGIRVFMSNELAYDDLLKNSELDNNIICVYGYFPIYYSKRRVLDLYNKHMDNKIDLKDNVNYFLKEELREERYNIIEYNTHSVITNAKKLLIFKELNVVKASYIYVSSYQLDNFKEVISIYRKSIDSNSFNEEDLNKLKLISKDYNSSLLYSNPSIL